MSIQAGSGEGARRVAPPGAVAIPGARRGHLRDKLKDYRLAEPETARGSTPVSTEIIPTERRSVRFADEPGAGAPEEETELAPAGGEKRRVRFAEPAAAGEEGEEDFHLSVETFTPQLPRGPVEYRRPEERPDVVAPAAGTLSNPNIPDALRRVAVVVLQHIRRCTERFEAATEDEHESGAFHVSAWRTFDEENFVEPQYLYSFVRAPAVFPGAMYTIRRVKRVFEEPTVDVIFEFMSTLFDRARLSNECVIVCLVYIERLMETGHCPLMANNWRPIVLCGLLLASKVWQDLASWNCEFSSVYPQFTLSNINRLERTFLAAIKWDLYVAGSQYARYYFAIRSLTEQKDFRRKYNYMMKVEAPHARRLEQRSHAVKTELLSRSM